MSSIEDVRALPPEERLKRLKELEDERKREIEEAEALIRDSMREIADVSEKRHAPIAQVKAGDISHLVTAEEKEIFRTARFGEGERRAAEPHQEEGLEQMAKNAPAEENNGKPVYGQAIEDARKRVDYSSAMFQEERKEEKGFYHAARDAGNVSSTYERQRNEERKKREAWIV